MTKYREILRLKNLGFSERNIAASCGISRNTVAKVTKRADELPMYDYFHRELLKRRFLMMDETPVQVLKEEGRRAQSKSYFWLVRTGEDVV